MVPKSCMTAIDCRNAANVYKDILKENEIQSHGDCAKYFSALKIAEELSCLNIRNMYGNLL
jgi:hypothetical protein